MDRSLDVAKKNISILKKAVVCFSGGIDSTALLSIAKEALGDGLTAVTVDVPMLSERQRDIALVIAKDLDIRLMTVKLEWSDLEGIERNDVDRCFICKQAMYRAVRKLADENHIDWILNGDLADDDESDRPGMKAAEGLGVVSPLREAGVTKDVTKAYVDSLGLELDLVKETCMLMRFPMGTPVTEDDLELVEDLEYSIRSITGIKQLRVRMHGRHLLLQTSAEERQLLLDSEPDIKQYMDSIGYSYGIMDQPYTGH